jgi:glutamyl-tRNA(Gln) amidotransferase subunit E
MRPCTYIGSLADKTSAGNSLVGRAIVSARGIGIRESVDMKTKLPPTDFEKLGFRCGLEIHQQLDTEKKLFCHCPVGLREDPPDAIILRHMRPTLSELGEYDGTALMEFKTRKNVIYQLIKGSTCTYEMDDTPPFNLNQQALDIALEIAMLLNCNIVDEIHISRKQYLDGSIPTGFQRTTVVGVEGWIPYKGRKIRITHICLEEDACREISDDGHTITFKADRLSTPLVEVITYHDMKTPQEAQEVNEELGRLLKASGKVRRGIGSVRQDVNVSIDGGTRVEIKGVMKTGYVHDLTYIEALRQKALLDIRAELQARGVMRKSLVIAKHDVSSELVSTESPVLREALSGGSVIKCAKIEGFAGLLMKQLQPGRTFADEIAGRIRVIACLDKMPNIFHSDDIDGSELTEDEWARIKAISSCKLTDAVVVVWGMDADVETALDEIKFRALEAIRGIPNETRQDIGGGVTDFERILPGPDRMYPDTDLPPLAVSEERLERVRQHRPERSYEKEERWRRLGVGDQIIRPLVISDKAEVFDRIISGTKADPNLVGRILTQSLKHMRRKKLPIDNVSDDSLFELFTHYDDGRFCREAIPLLLNSLCNPGEGKTVSQILDDNDFAQIPDSDIQNIVNQEIANAEDMSLDRRQRVGYLMGHIMSRLRGRAPGKKVRHLLETTLI